MQPAQFRHGWVNIQETDDAGTALVGFSQAGDDERERDVGGFFPEDVFLPVQLFAEVPTVIAPEYDECVGGIWAFVKGVEHAADAGVGEAARGQISLHGAFPKMVGDNHLVVAGFEARRLVGPEFSGRRQIGNVIFFYFRQNDFVERMHVEIFLRDTQGDVRFEKTDSEEERTIIGFGQMTHGPVGDFHVRHLVVGGGERSPAERLFLRVRIARRFDVVEGNWKVFLPRFGIRAVILDVENLAAAEHAITIGAKVLWERHHIGNEFAKAMLVAIDAGGGWPQARDQRDPRRIAEGRGAVGMGEEHAAFGEAIDVRCAGLRMNAERADPTVHIINGDEEDVWLRRRVN